MIVNYKNMEPSMIDYYNSYPTGIRIIDKMNEELSDSQGDVTNLETEITKLKAVIEDYKDNVIFDLLFNHDLINKDNFSIKIEKEISLDLLIKKSSLDCQKLLINFCKKNDISFKAIEILTSLIWINMAPLHEHPLDLFLYFFGKYNLFINTDFEKLR